MKIPLFVSVTICLFFTILQPMIGQNGNDRLQNEKIAFFTKNLQLTPQEAQLFWPVYNEYFSKKTSLNKLSQNTLNQYASRDKNLSEKDVEKVLQKYIEIQNQENELINVYNKKFLEILPPGKVMDIYVTEIEFRKYLLNKLREQRSMNIRR